MTDAGRRAVEVAKANGSWTIYDAVEDLLEPDDLAAALDASPAARAAWDGFPPSARKQMLWWVISARQARDTCPDAHRQDRVGGGIGPPRPGLSPLQPAKRGTATTGRAIGTARSNDVDAVGAVELVVGDGLGEPST